MEEYHRLGEFNENGRRTELIRGILIEKMSKSPLHYYLIETLRRMLAGQMQAEWDLRQEGPLTTGDSEPEPDLAVVTGLSESFARRTRARLLWQSRSQCHRFPWTE